MRSVPHLIRTGCQRRSRPFLYQLSMSFVGFCIHWLVFDDLGGWFAELDHVAGRYVLSEPNVDSDVRSFAALAE